MWEKILDELDENDLFPLALSCKYFRQKQEELVARSRQHGPESGKSQLALKTTLAKHKLTKCHPVSAEYARFCREEKVLERKHHSGSLVGIWDSSRAKDTRIQCLAAYYGHLPLLQEILKSATILHTRHFLEIACRAGESPSSQSLLLFCFGF